MKNSFHRFSKFLFGIIALLLALTLSLPACRTAAPGRGEVLVKFYLAEKDHGDNIPQRGKGWFTKDGKKIPGSDFDIPAGANDLRIKLVMDPATGEVWIEEIQFTKDGQPVGGIIRPPAGTKPNDIEGTL